MTASVTSMNKINNTVKNIVKTITPFVKIVLFGSYARNEANSQSDFDFLVVVPYQLDIKDKIRLRSKIRKALLEKGIRSDILIQSDDELQAKNLIPGHIVRSILREGVLL